MDQHPIPRQITTFEFKLIGFLTIKQFIYLVVFIPLAIITYYIFPIPLLNILAAIIIGLIGVAFAFMPINDRPMEVWVKNLIKRLTSPTQYHFHKNNPAIYFLKNLVFTADPHRVTAHIDSQEKLAKYLNSRSASAQKQNKKKDINNLLANPMSFFTQKKDSLPTTTNQVEKESEPVPVNQAPAVKQPFLTGVAKNHKQTPLAGLLVYVKNDQAAAPLRILKTNQHGVFTTFNPLPPGDYIFEVKDPKHSVIFDTMKFTIGNQNTKPVEIYSKELI